MGRHMAGRSWQEVAGHRRQQVVDRGPVAKSAVLPLRVRTGTSPPSGICRFRPGRICKARSCSDGSCSRPKVQAPQSLNLWQRPPDEAAEEAAGARRSSSAAAQWRAVLAVPWNVARAVVLQVVRRAAQQSV